jgi:hypothetical protein
MLYEIRGFIVGVDENYRRMAHDIVSKICKLLRMFWWSFVPLLLSNHKHHGKCSFVQRKKKGSMRISRISTRLYGVISWKFLIITDIVLRQLI